MSTIAITNPSDESAEAQVVATDGAYYPARILTDFGSLLEDGAQVVMTDPDTGRVWQYLATRDGDSIALRTNNALREVGGRIPFVRYAATGRAGEGDIVDEMSNPLGGQLETFTVFGNNDDGDDFVAVVSATEDTVHDVGVQAGLVDEGFEGSVSISCILKGDHGDAAIHYII